MNPESIRARLRQHQDLLDRFEWPTWARNGTVLAALALGAVCLWDPVRGQQPTPSPNIGPGGTAALLALTVAPWVVRAVIRPTWWRSTPAGDLVFCIAVLVPFASLGLSLWPTRGFVPIQPDLVMLIGLLLVIQMTACARLWCAAFAVSFVGSVAHARSIWIYQPQPGLDLWMVAVTAAGVGGLAIRGGIVTLQRLHDAQDELASHAVATERRRLAGEVHDVVAHTLAVTMLHVTGARMAMATDPTRALVSLEDAERQGRAGMADVRGMVRLLRLPDESDDRGETPWPADAPLPTLADVPELIAGYEQAGLRIDADLGAAQNQDPVVGSHPGMRPPVPASVGLAAYRVAQESLANASSHGTGSAVIRMGVDPTEVSVIVTNQFDVNRHHGQTGAGLIGMRERVAALGGTLTAGIADDEPIAAESDRRTWVVHVRIPLGEVG